MAINAKRLLKLADYLETVSARRFNMSSWTNEEIGCGFAGCAIGWCAYAGIVPGLKLKPDVELNKDGWGNAHVGDIEFIPTYEGAEGFTAVEDAFFITERQARHLFGAEAYRKVGGTPKQVAKRIRKFVRDNTRVSP